LIEDATFAAAMVEGGALYRRLNGTQ
jgi:hypothetical protein